MMDLLIKMLRYHSVRFYISEATSLQFSRQSFAHAQSAMCL